MSDSNYRYDDTLAERYDMVEEVSEIYTYSISNEHDKIFKDILNDKEEFLKNAVLARNNTPDNKLEQMDKILSIMLTKQIGEEEGQKFLEDLNRKDGKNKMVLAVERMFERENKKLIRQGRREGTLEIAKKMLKEGFNIDLIDKITGLGKKKIEELSHKA